MNKIFLNETAPKPLTQEGLNKKWQDIGYFDDYDSSRIEGDMCDCEGNGEFVLLPDDDEAVIEGGKPYMVCRKCGLYSHL